MGIKSSKHAFYDLKYHVVWVPQYRKYIFDSEMRGFVKEVFQQIADEYEFSIDTMEVMEDHVHIFVEALPRYSPAQVVQIMKCISAREVFKKYPKLRKQLGRMNCVMMGTFVRSVGDKVTADIFRKYIEYQTRQDDASHLKMFE